MSERACGCGLVATDGDELADHLGEMFIPADDVGADGRAHAERFRSGADGSRWECLCGFAAIEMAALDAHLLAAFTPADGTGHDGQSHGGQRHDGQRHDGQRHDGQWHDGAG